MRAARHPLRDGIVAVAVGGVLALLLLAGVGAVQHVAGRAPTDQAQPQPSSPDACLIRDEGGGGGGPAQPDPAPGPEFPRQEHQLDTGRPIEVRGSGNAEVAYERLGGFATVVDFECANCTGPVLLFNTGPALPIVSGEGGGEPVAVEWLIDTVHEMSDGPHNSLLLRASGDWTLTLRSWRDLSIQTRPFEGRGAKVVRVDASAVRVSFAPLNSRDTLNMYAYRLSDRSFTVSTCVGRFESRVLDLDGGDVLLIWARGEWTLEPV